MKRDTMARTLGVSVAAGAAALAAYILGVRPWYLRWGATEAEFEVPLPGDEIIPRPRHRDTHAITVRAPVVDVWPWLVQMGQGRGGFYSYDWLENLIGCDIHNADQIFPDFQSLRVGDSVRLHPKAPPLPVAIVEPCRALVLNRTAA